MRRRQWTSTPSALAGDRRKPRHAPATIAIKKGTSLVTAAAHPHAEEEDEDDAAAAAAAAAVDEEERSSSATTTTAATATTLSEPRFPLKVLPCRPDASQWRRRHV